MQDQQLQLPLQLPLRLPLQLPLPLSHVSESDSVDSPRGATHVDSSVDDYADSWKFRLKHRCRMTLGVQLERFGVRIEDLALETLFSAFHRDQFGQGGWVDLLPWFGCGYLFDWFQRVCPSFEDTSPEVALMVSEDDLVELRDLCLSVLSHGCESARLDAADEAFPMRNGKHDDFSLWSIAFFVDAVGTFLPGSGHLQCFARPSCHWALTIEKH